MSAFDARIVQKTILDEIKLDGTPLGVSMTPEEYEKLTQIAEGSKIKDAVKCLPAAIPGLAWGIAIGVTAYGSLCAVIPATRIPDALPLIRVGAICTGIGFAAHNLVTDYWAALQKAAERRAEARALLALGYRPVRGAAYLGLKDLCAGEIAQRPEKVSFEKLARAYAQKKLHV